MRKQWKVCLLISGILLMWLALVSTAGAASVQVNPDTGGTFTQDSTQPADMKVGMTPFPKCAKCHADKFTEAAGVPMFNAGLDPVMRTQLSIANQDIPGIGDLCLRCHTPSGWLNDKSHAPGGDEWGSNMTAAPAIDKFGQVSQEREGMVCDFCHRVTGQEKRVSKVDGAQIPKGTGSFHLDGDLTQSYSQQHIDYMNSYTGSWPPPGGGPLLAPSKNGDFLRSAEFCGTCHDVTNPALPSLNNPTNNHPVERTYTEWKYSWYGDSKYTCQTCHLPNVQIDGSGKVYVPAEGVLGGTQGYDPPVLANYSGEPGSSMLKVHNHLVGGSSWLASAFKKLYPNKDAGWVQAGFDVPQSRDAAWDAMAANADAMVRNAAWMDVNPTSTGLSVKVTNRSGHKLPTGYPEGRRVWLNVRAFDANGRLISEDCGYNYDTATLNVGSCKKIYEHTVESAQGEEFHFVLNQDIKKDNRIPPKGYKKLPYEQEGAHVIGANYANGQNWDITEFSLPAGTARWEVYLLYQSQSKEAIEALRRLDQTRDTSHGGTALATPDGSATWGEALYNTWLTTGKSKPVVMQRWSSDGTFTIQ